MDLLSKKYSFYLIILLSLLASCNQNVSKRIPIKNNQIIETQNARPITENLNKQVTVGNKSFYDDFFKDVKDEVANGNIKKIKTLNKEDLNKIYATEIMDKDSQKMAQTARIADTQKIKKTTSKIYPRKNGDLYVVTNLDRGYYIQIGAYARKSNALKVATKLYSYDVVINKSFKSNVFKILIGPLKQRDDAINLKKRIVEKGFSNTIIIRK